jgi:hypothetical protein
MALMGATAAYFFGIFLGSVLTIGVTALWKVSCKAEENRLQREAAMRRYCLEQRIKQRDENR